MKRITIGLVLLAASAVPGCSWDEGLLIRNMRGRVFVPVEAITRDIQDADGNTVTIGPDIKLMGPVYLGVFPSVAPANVIERFPHPEVGPQYIDGVSGDAYPYGGTTVGDLRYPCLDFLTCKLVSGRYVDYDEMIDWFKTVGQPIVDPSGAEVEDGEYIQQTCFDLLAVTSDSEIRLTAYEDRNDDEKIDKLDLDFVDNGDGYYVADFTLWQQEFFWDQNQENCTPGEDCTGFSLWGWMDAPSTTTYQYTTCNPASGFINNWYNSNFYGGAAYVDTLNFPSTYITDGDYTAPEGHVWSDIYEEPDLYLDFVVQ
ncbi:MAG: hypothetical protein ABMA64_08060 [Myxococcota bacterium]